MIKVYTADYIFPVSSEPIRNGAIAVNEDGEIIEIGFKDDAKFYDRTIETFKGILVPGFVNTHCHLELSYLYDKIPKHEGLIPFIQKVISSRSADTDLVTEAMEKADGEMWDNGIVAVGDISNNILSRDVKQRSRLFYHTFIELIGFNPDKAKEIYEAGHQLKADFSPLRSSIVPHAPYSVCKELLKYITQAEKNGASLLSIHNQETEEENKFFRYKKGKFLDFYKHLDLNIDFFKPQARNSIQSIIPLFPEKRSVMLVHNTYTSLKDIYFVQRFGRDITWCFCPRANLFIENKLPKIDLFQLSDYKITLGTDSLASNDKLCIFSELKTLHEFYPSLDLRKTMSWATLNGAEFLKIENRYGSIEKGKRPGLNLITNTDGMHLTSASEVKKIL
jgi:aminodeoxyfutalosine deaminase